MHGESVGRGASSVVRRAHSALRSTLLALLLAGCGQITPGPTNPPPPTSTSVQPVATETPLPPTATPVPPAARVNGVEIPVAAYTAEVELCEIGFAQAGRDPAVCSEAALQAVIEAAVIEQAATAAGLAVDSAAVDAALAQAEQARGGADAFAQYLAAIGYTAETYREAMRRDLLRAQMTAQVAGAVAPQAEQVHALLILVGTEVQAQALLAGLRGGADFASYALENSLDASSRVGGGDLGWFARGTLTLPEVEAAAFALQPGELSDVIATSLGYAIVRVEAREPDRALSSGQLETLRAAAVQSWLKEQLAGAQIETFVTP
ncbi:MAG TPA: peptidylprolyl isomerase [Anaerolineales bacterium]|nr:peptidylprolyl isomerase [Anaerolineales bacterium]